MFFRPRPETGADPPFSVARISNRGSVTKLASPPIGERAMTGAERMERYRQRHARKLAGRAARRGHQGPPITWAALTPTRKDWNAWFVTTDDEPSQTIGTN
jgi:hypothetical protein